MKNEKELFDKIIQEKLNDLEAPFSAPDWDRMEELLDEEDAAAADFDRMAAGKLRRMEPPYDPGAWDIMARRIDEAFSIRHWLHRNHVPELALMVLIGLTLVRYFSGHTPPAAIEEIKEMRAWEKIDKIPGGGNNKEWLLAEPDLIAAGPASISEIKAGPPAAVESLPSAPVFANPSGQALPAISGVDVSNRLKGIAFSTKGEMPKLEAYAQGSALAAIGAFKAIVRKPLRWYLSGFAGSDYTFVHSPADELLQTESYWIDSIGNTAGLSLLVEGRKWGLLAGLGFSRLSYVPKVPLQVYGTFDYLIVESFQGIQYQLMRAPLQVRRGFLPQGSGWDVYAMGGMEANILLNAKYDIHREIIESSRAVEPEPNAAELSKLNEKKFPEGILQGGNLTDNTYLNFSAGVGMESQISARFRVFAEAVYSRPFLGQQFGPNADQIHQVSLRVGGKIRIK